MSQRTSGVFRVLSTPSGYKTMQNLVGAKRARKSLVKDYFNLSTVNRILDIGCGTADVLDELPDAVEYVGFDASEDYISYARKKYASRKATFYAQYVEKSNIADFGKFDLVIATGVLHHLDDGPAIELFEMANSALCANGRLFTIDPCFVDQQSRLSHRLISSDRGQNVRTLQQYEDLASSTFSSLSVSHRNDLLRVPYDHAIMLCSNIE